MLIRKIEQIQKGKQIITREDDAFLCLYTRETKALAFEEGKACTKEQWDRGIKTVETRGKKRIFHLLGRKDYTASEVARKLTKEHYDAPQIEAILAYFEGYGYIDDANYVRKYYQYYKATKSRRAMVYKLKEKGIDDGLMREVLDEEAAEDDDYNSALRHATKKYGHKTLLQADKGKMIQSLMRKGYPYNISKAVIDNVFSNSNKE